MLHAPLMIAIHPTGMDVPPLTLDLTVLDPTGLRLAEPQEGAGGAAPTEGATQESTQEIVPRPSGEEEGAPPKSPFGSVWMLALIGVVIWFLIFAPERKARKQRDEMMGALKKGDKIITAGGLHGQVVEVRDDEVTIKAHDTRLTFSKSSISQIRGVKDGDNDSAKG